MLAMSLCGTNWYDTNRVLRLQLIDQITPALLIIIDSVETILPRIRFDPISCWNILCRTWRGEELSICILVKYLFIMLYQVNRMVNLQLIEEAR